MEIFIYLILGLSSFFFVVIPMSGSFVINPLLALIIDPHAAISIAAFFFLLNSIIKAFVFRKDILLEYVRGILPISLLGSVSGALLIAYIHEKILLLIILAFSIHFLVKTVINIFSVKSKKQSTNKFVLSTMSLMSGFMQGTGLGSGGGLRKQYLLAENISLAEMNGTASFISIWIMLASVFVRLGTNQVVIGQLVPILYLIPVMIVATMIGRTILKKMSKKTASVIILITMFIITVTFGYQVIFSK